MGIPRPRPKSEVNTPKILRGKEVESKANVSMDSKTAGITSVADESATINSQTNKTLIDIKSLLSGIIKETHFFNVQKPSVSVLENEDDIEQLGDGLTVRQVYGKTLSGFNPMDELIFQQHKQKILAEDNSEETQAEIRAVEKEWEEKKAHLEKYILDLKINTSVDINSIRVYNDALANSLCAKYGVKALICFKGILLANGQEQDVFLLCEALKMFGRNFSNFMLKGQGTWHLHYTMIPEILPIFKLVADSKKKLLDKFNDGDFFYKWGTSIVQGGWLPWGTHSLDKADKLEDAYQIILEAAIKDSKDCYVPFGKGPEGKKAFNKVFGTTYDSSAIVAASDEAKKLIYLVEPIKSFRDHGTPDFNSFVTFWRDDDHLRKEMDTYNGYLLEMLERMGSYGEKISKFTNKAKKISEKTDPKCYDEWRDTYVKVYDGLDDEKEKIEDNAKSKLIKAYGKYGEFYYDIINEIRNSKIAAFLVETTVSIAIGGGTGLVAKKVGTMALKKGGELVAKEGGELIAKEGGELIAKEGGKLLTKENGKQLAKFLGKEAIDNTLFTGVANLDGFKFFGGREISAANFALSAGIGFGSSVGLGGVFKLIGLGRKAYRNKQLKNAEDKLSSHQSVQEEFGRNIKNAEGEIQNTGSRIEFLKHYIENGGRKRELNEAKSEIERLVREKEEIGKMLELFKKHKDIHADELPDIKKQAEKLKEKLSANETAQEEIKRELKNTEDKLSYHQAMQEEFGRKIKNAEGVIQNTESQIDNIIMDYIANGGRKQKLSEAKSKIEKLVRKKEEKGKMLELFKKHKDIHAGELPNIKKQAERLKEKLSANETAQEEIKRELKNAEDKLSSHQSVQEEFGRNIKNAEGVIQNAESQIDDCIMDYIAKGEGKPKLSEAKSEIERLLRNKEEIVIKLEHLKKNKRKYADISQNINAKAEKLKEKPSANQAAQQEIKGVNKEISSVQTAKKEIKGVKGTLNYVLEKVNGCIDRAPLVVQVIAEVPKFIVKFPKRLGQAYFRIFKFLESVIKAIFNEKSRNDFKGYWKKIINFLPELGKNSIEVGLAHLITDLLYLDSSPSTTRETKAKNSASLGFDASDKDPEELLGGTELDPSISEEDKSEE